MCIYTSIALMRDGYRGISEACGLDGLVYVVGIKTNQPMKKLSQSRWKVRTDNQGHPLTSTCIYSMGTLGHECTCAHAHKHTHTQTEKERKGR